MIGAFLSSTAFLISYIVYHASHGDTSYTGTGAIRTVYFVLLISHILLSTAVVPMALAAFYFAIHGRFETHKKITKILLPIWLYVSVTGVLIYLMLHVF